MPPPADVNGLKSLMVKSLPSNSTKAQPVGKHPAWSGPLGQLLKDSRRRNKANHRPVSKM